MNSVSLFLEWLEMPPWYYFFSLIIAVFVSVYFYFKSKRVRSPRYSVRSYNIIAGLPKIESLEMLYAGQGIENLTATKILFWNAGRETIDSEDVAEKISVHAKNGYKILNASVVEEKETANKFWVPSYDQSQAQLDFEYIDKDQGAVVQILHTGKSSEDLEIRGTIKGAGKLTRVPIMHPHFVRDTLWLTMITVASAIAFLAYGISQAQELFVVVSSFAAGSAIGIVSGYVTRFYRSRIPKGFDSFEEGPEKI